MSSLARFLLRHRKRTKRNSRQYSGRLPQDFEHSVIARRLNEEGRCRKSASSSWKTFATQQMSRRHQPGGLTLMNKLKPSRSLLMYGCGGGWHYHWQSSSKHEFFGDANQILMCSIPAAISTVKFVSMSPSTAAKANSSSSRFCK